MFPIIVEQKAIKNICQAWSSAQFWAPSTWETWSYWRQFTERPQKFWGGLEHLSCVERMRAETVQPQEEDVYGGSCQCIIYLNWGCWEEKGWLFQGCPITIQEAVADNWQECTGFLWTSESCAGWPDRSLFRDIQNHLDMVLGSLL